MDTNDASSEVKHQDSNIDWNKVVKRINEPRHVLAKAIDLAMRCNHVSGDEPGDALDCDLMGFLLWVGVNFGEKYHSQREVLTQEDEDRKALLDWLLNHVDFMRRMVRTARFPENCSALGVSPDELLGVVMSYCGDVVRVCPEFGVIEVTDDERRGQLEERISDAAINSKIRRRDLMHVARRIESPDIALLKVLPLLDRCSQAFISTPNDRLGKAVRGFLDTLIGHGRHDAVRPVVTLAAVN